MPMSVETYVALGLDPWGPNEINGRSNAEIMKSLNVDGDAAYHPCAEAYPVEGNEQGTVTKFADWQQTQVYAGSIRDIWVYSPPGMQNLSSVIVFNDGGDYYNPQGAVRATHVLDNMLAAGEIEPTVAVFINPGSPRVYASQRSYEYDSMTPDYGRFLIDDVLPFVEKELGVTFTDDPRRRTVCGISSGGICAFNTAWHHPDSFARVLSHCGSFTNIRGGHNFPYMVRTTQRKDIRVILQSGEQDASLLLGDWPLANKTMADALAYAGYDYRFEFGTGGHSRRHGGAIFADSLRWLWRD